MTVGMGDGRFPLGEAVALLNQKQAYTTVVILGVQPGELHRFPDSETGEHGKLMIAIALFILGHLVMVALHGWQNFVSMLTGWKKDPEYLSQ